MTISHIVWWPAKEVHAMTDPRERDDDDEVPPDSDDLPPDVRDGDVEPEGEA